MQADLQLRLGIGAGLVSGITIPASCSWNWSFAVGVLDGQFASFGEKHPFVSIELSSIHFKSCRIRTEDFSVEGHISPSLCDLKPTKALF